MEEVRLAWLPFLAASLACALDGCGGSTSAGSRQALVSGVSVSRTTSTASRPAPVASATPSPPKPVSTLPVVRAPGPTAPQWQPVATIAGQPAAWIAQRSGVTLMRFDQARVRLALHAGSAEPGGGGWRYGSDIEGSEAHLVVAGFNGGFRLDYGSVGFMADGRVAAPLSAGLGSIVTYRDGVTEIGAWEEGVPARGRPIASVLQDLKLLVNRGAPAGDVETCAIECWGATLGGGVDVARSALGIRGDGQLVWAAGGSLSPAAIAGALAGAGVQRAVELDINPEWVAGYLYLHRGSGPVPVPLVPGQTGIPGELLSPYARDFFTVLAR
jgi:hypothetical protein